MIATLVTTNVDIAQWLALIGAALLAVAAVGWAPATRMPRLATWTPTLLAAGLVLVALALFFGVPGGT